MEILSLKTISEKLDYKASLDSPNFTGIPTTSLATDDNVNQITNVEYVNKKLSKLNGIHQDSIVVGSETSTLFGYNPISFGEYSHVEGVGNVAGFFTEFTIESINNNEIKVPNDVYINTNLVDRKAVISGPKPMTNALFKNIIATVTSINNDTKIITIDQIINNPNQYTELLIDNPPVTSGRPPVTSYSRAFHAEGYNTKALGHASHAEGYNTSSYSMGSHSEGYGTKAIGYASHAEGALTVAKHNNSHAEGYSTVASAYGAHSQNLNTTATVSASTAMGRFNKPMTGNDSSFNQLDDAWIIGNGTGDTVRSNAIRMSFNGDLFMSGVTNSTGADYAEYFEWSDKNLNNEDRVGFFVTLDGDKIRKAVSTDDYILGIISSTASIIGDSYQDDWNGKYLTDEWDRPQYEWVDMPAKLDENGEEIQPAVKNYIPVINPEWNSSEEYIPRAKRSEWSPVGLIGKLLVRDNGECQPNSYCSPNDEGIAIPSDRGYRVMKRITDNIIQVLVK